MRVKIKKAEPVVVSDREDRVFILRLAESVGIKCVMVGVPEGLYLVPSNCLIKSSSGKVEVPIVAFPYLFFAQRTQHRVQSLTKKPQPIHFLLTMHSIKRASALGPKRHLFVFGMRFRDPNTVSAGNAYVGIGFLENTQGREMFVEALRASSIGTTSFFVNRLGRVRTIKEFRITPKGNEYLPKDFWVGPDPRSEEGKQLTTLGVDMKLMLFSLREQLALFIQFYSNTIGSRMSIEMDRRDILVFWCGPKSETAWDLMKEWFLDHKEPGITCFFLVLFLVLIASSTFLSDELFPKETEPVVEKASKTKVY